MVPYDLFSRWWGGRIPLLTPIPGIFLSRFPALHHPLKSIRGIKAEETKKGEVCRP